MLLGLLYMRALVKKSAEKYDVAIIDVPVPEVQAGEVLVKVTAGSICGSDLHMYLGHKGYSWVDYPIVLGHEVTGSVEAVGNEVDKAILGKRVVVNPYIPCNRCENCINSRENICEAGTRTLTAPPRSLQFGFRKNGGMAEYMVVPGDNVLPVGDGVPDSIAAILESIAVGVHAVNKAGEIKNQDIVIFGPGPIGLGITAVCKGLGANRIIVAGLSDDQGRLEIAEKLGAIALTINDNDFSNIITLLQENPARVIFDCSGHPSVPENSIHVLKKGGELILVGISTGKFSLPMDYMVRGEICIKGTYGTNKESFLQAINYAGLPQFTFEHIITHKFKLEESVAAFEAARAKKGAKVLIYP